MEHNSSVAQLPDDIWRVILAFIDNFYALITLKRVSRWLRREILQTKLLDSIDNVKINPKMISYFTRRKISQTIPDATTTIKIISPKIVSFTSIKEKQNDVFKLLQENRAQLPNNGVFVSSTGIQVHPRITIIPEDSFGIYWLGGHAGVLMFSLEDRSSFISVINQWLPFCYQQRTSLNPRTVYHLIGLAPKDKSKCHVTRHEIELLADLFGLKYHEVLSDSLMNLVQPIQSLCEDLALVQLTPTSPDIYDNMNEDDVNNEEDRKCLIM